MTSGTGTPAAVTDEDARDRSADRRRYGALRSAEVCARVRWAAALAVVCPLAGMVLDAVVVPRDLAPRLSANLLIMGSGVAVTVALRRPWGARRARALALALIAATTVGLAWLVRLSRADVDVFVSVFAAGMLSSALLIPWGIAAQAAASAILTLAYAAVADWSAWSAEHSAAVVMALADGLGLSLIGAFLVDRARWTVFVERERVARAHDRAVHEREEARRTARQRALLLRASRELGATTELSALCQRIVILARELAACDGVGLLLAVPERNLLRLAGVASDDPVQHERLGAGLAGSGPIPVRELAERGLVEVPGGGDWDRFAGFLRTLGLPRVLFAGLRDRDGGLLGLLALVRRRPEAAFGDDDRALVEGFRHQAATALANARLVEALERANRLKTEFVSTMSHELRTPLHVIMGYAEMLNDLGTATLGTAVDRIRFAGRDLLELVETTLDVNRLEAGSDPPRIEPVDLAIVWAELAAEFVVVPRRPTVRLHWEPAPVLTLHTDRRKLKIIVKNLVANALKYTLEGHVMAACQATPTGCDVVVRDTGIGIAPDQLEGVFEMFRQADGSDTRPFGGVGLGLYIVKRLTEQLGGSVRVESTLHQGSTFTTTLPGLDAPVTEAA